MSVAEPFLVWVKYLEDFVDILFDAMAVNIESAERFEEVEHFIDAFTDDEHHFIAVVEFEEMCVLQLPRQDTRQCPIKGIDQSVINVKNDIQSWTQTMSN